MFRKLLIVAAVSAALMGGQKQANAYAAIDCLIQVGNLITSNMAGAEYLAEQYFGGSYTPSQFAKYWTMRAMQICGP